MSRREFTMLLVLSESGNDEAGHAIPALSAGTG